MAQKNREDFEFNQYFQRLDGYIKCEGIYINLYFGRDLIKKFELLKQELILPLFYIRDREKFELWIRVQEKKNDGKTQSKSISYEQLDLPCADYPTMELPALLRHFDIVNFL